jgi:hypothetical protein
MYHMYPYERHMVVMKCYICNCVHPEGSTTEGYTTEEVIKCCIDYMKDGNPIGRSQFYNTMVDSLGKEPKDINHSLMLLTKESVRNILASCNSLWL